MDRCRVWESHPDPEVRRISKPMPEPVYPTYVVKQPDYETEPVCVVAVNKPNSPVDQNEELLKKVLAVLTPMVSSPARAPDLSPMDKLVQLLLSETARREPAPPTQAEPPGLETLLQTYFAEHQSLRQGPRVRQGRRNWSDVKWKNGPQCDPLPNVRCDLPIHTTGVEGREDIDWLLDDIA